MSPGTLYQQWWGWRCGRNRKQTAFFLIRNGTLISLNEQWLVHIPTGGDVKVVFWIRCRKQRHTKYQILALPALLGSLLHANLRQKHFSSSPALCPGTVEKLEWICGAWWQVSQTEGKKPTWESYSSYWHGIDSLGSSDFKGQDNSGLCCWCPSFNCLHFLPFANSSVVQKSGKQEWSVELPAWVQGHRTIEYSVWKPEVRLNEPCEFFQLLWFLVQASTF